MAVKRAHHRMLPLPRPPPQMLSGMSTLSLHPTLSALLLLLLFQKAGMEASRTALQVPLLPQSALRQPASLSCPALRRPPASHSSLRGPRQFPQCCEQCSSFAVLRFQAPLSHSLRALRVRAPQIARLPSSRCPPPMLGFSPRPAVAS